MQRITLCADDYGQSIAISQGILALLQARRLSAVSCLVEAADWQTQAALLKPFASQIEIGLHFNLTHHKASLPRVILKAFLRRFHLQALVSAWHAQLDAFEAGMGCLPRFIDGHQHVHQLPMVRDALLIVYKERLQATMPWVRVANVVLPYTDSQTFLKKILIQRTGAAPLAALLQQNHIPHNPSFSGIYPFNRATHYRQYFQEFLRESKEGGVIMCHPGLPDLTANDPLATSRPLEYQYFMSPDFLADCSHCVPCGI